MPPQTNRNGAVSRGREEWLVLVPGFLALAPYVLYHGMFGRLFWFGDEFDLIDQFDRMGFGPWIWTAFSENFVPLFKVLWGGSVLAFGGSYVAMMAIVWVTHALNVALLGRLLRVCGFSWAAVVTAQVVFGLSPSNLETLAWSVQWSAMLSVTFMLLALASFFERPSGRAPIAWAAASALSFSRGVLTGLLVGAVSLWPWSGSLPRRIGRALAFALPSIAVALVIAVMVPTGNQRHMQGHWEAALVYGAWYYLLNPAHYLFGIESAGTWTLALTGFLKVWLMGWCLARSRGDMRLLFAVLVAFDIGNAVLLGIGRYQMGLLTAMSSRYQYASLIACVPAAGFWVSRQWERLPVPARPRSAAFWGLLAAAAVVLSAGWPNELDPFTVWRGTDSRRILDPSGPASAAVPGYPGFPIERARELIAKYDLH